MRFFSGMWLVAICFISLLVSKSALALSHADTRLVVHASLVLSKGGLPEAEEIEAIQNLSKSYSRNVRMKLLSNLGRVAAQGSTELLEAYFRALCLIVDIDSSSHLWKAIEDLRSPEAVSLAGIRSEIVAWAQATSRKLQPELSEDPYVDAPAHWIADMMQAEEYALLSSEVLPNLELWREIVMQNPSAQKLFEHVEFARNPEQFILWVNAITDGTLNDPDPKKFNTSAIENIFTQTWFFENPRLVGFWEGRVDEFINATWVSGSFGNRIDDQLRRQLVAASTIKHILSLPTVMSSARLRPIWLHWCNQIVDSISSGYLESKPNPLVLLQAFSSVLGDNHLLADISPHNNWHSWMTNLVHSRIGIESDELVQVLKLKDALVRPDWQGLALSLAQHSNRELALLDWLQTPEVQATESFSRLAVAFLVRPFFQLRALREFLPRLTRHADYAHFLIALEHTEHLELLAPFIATPGAFTALGNHWSRFASRLIDSGYGLQLVELLADEAMPLPEWPSLVENLFSRYRFSSELLICVQTFLLSERVAKAHPEVWQRLVIYAISAPVEERNSLDFILARQVMPLVSRLFEERLAERYQQALGRKQISVRQAMLQDLLAPVGCGPKTKNAAPS